MKPCSEIASHTKSHGAVPDFPPLSLHQRGGLPLLVEGVSWGITDSLLGVGWGSPHSRRA